MTRGCSHRDAEDRGSEDRVAGNRGAEDRGAGGTVHVINLGWCTNSGAVML